MDDHKESLHVIIGFVNLFLYQICDNLQEK